MLELQFVKRELTGAELNLLEQIQTAPSIQLTIGFIAARTFENIEAAPPAVRDALLRELLLQPASHLRRLFYFAATQADQITRRAVEAVNAELGIPSESQPSTPAPERPTDEDDDFFSRHSTISTDSP